MYVCSVCTCLVAPLCHVPVEGTGNGPGITCTMEGLQPNTMEPILLFTACLVPPSACMRIECCLLCCKVRRAHQSWLSQSKPAYWQLHKHGLSCLVRHGRVERGALSNTLGKSASPGLPHQHSVLCAVQQRNTACQQHSLPKTQWQSPDQ